MAFQAQLFNKIHLPLILLAAFNHTFFINSRIHELPTLNLHCLCINRSITLPKLGIVQKMFNLTLITARLRVLVAPTLALKIQVALGHIHIYLFPISTLKLFSAMKAFLRITDQLKKQLK